MIRLWCITCIYLVQVELVCSVTGRLQHPPSSLVSPPRLLLNTAAPYLCLTHTCIQQQNNTTGISWSPVNNSVSNVSHVLSPNRKPLFSNLVFFQRWPLSLPVSSLLLAACWMVYCVLLFVVTGHRPLALSLSLSLYGSVSACLYRPLLLQFCII